MYVSICVCSGAEETPTRALEFKLIINQSKSPQCEIFNIVKHGETSTHTTTDTFYHYSSAMSIYGSQSVPLVICLSASCKTQYLCHPLHHGVSFYYWVHVTFHTGCYVQCYAYAIIVKL